MHELAERELVLLGAGHTHLHLLRMWRMQPIAGVRLTCVANTPRAAYSGMLPGTLAGQYTPDQMHVDLVRRCAAVGARLILGETTGLDRTGRQLLLRDRPPLPYDVLSIALGSRPAPVDGLEHATSIKPMPSFLERLEHRLSAVGGDADRPLRVVVVGGGAGGVEIALCLAPFVRRRFPSRGLDLTLVDRGPRLLGGARDAAAARRVARLFAERGARVLLGHHARAVTRDGVVVENEQGTAERIPADAVIWAAGAVGPKLLGKFGLPTDADGFLLTNVHLRSVADPAIFVVGDSGTCPERPHPKAGVYAVRQGPVLWENVRRALEGQALQEWQPQGRFLSLLNTGDGRAVLNYRGHAAHGRWCWRLKDRIDRRFMRKHQDYRPARMPAARRAADGSDAMRCAGCGGKVAAATLERVLARIDNPVSPAVRTGLAQADDVAAVALSRGNTVVATTDFFAAFLDDPYLVGRVAALNAMSDLWAKSAEPTAALVHAVLPGGGARQQEQLLYELLAGSLAEFRPLGVPIVGGHTIEGEETVFGFTLLGEHPEPAAMRRKSGLAAGDRLVLTKPLGTGVLLAAHRHARCAAPWFESLLAAMLESNRAAARVADEFSLAAATDVTGFGLAGHLLEMLRGTELFATIDPRAVPLLPGAETLLREGFESSLAPANRRAAEREMLPAEASVERSGGYAALFDPQTSGGLLLGVDEGRLEVVCERLRQAGCGAAVVGRAERRTDAQHRLVLAETARGASVRPAAHETDAPARAL